MMTTTDTVTTITISIPAYKMEQFEEIFSKIVKKQIKYGMELGSFEVKEKYLVDKKIYIGNYCCGNRKVEYIKIEVKNVSIIKKDNADEYQYAGTIKKDWITGIQTEYTVDNKYHEWMINYPTVCDHCKTSRQRNSYYVFDYQGKPVYIGSTCAKDYFGIDGMDMIRLYDNFYQTCNYDDDMDDNFIAIKPQYVSISFQEVVNYTTKLIMNKWSNLDKDEMADMAEKIFFDKVSCPNTAESLALYEKVKSYYENPKNGFEQNCHNVLMNNYCVYKNWKLYFCAVFMALQKIERSKNQALAGNQTVVNNYNIGERIIVTGKVIYKKEMEGHGYTYNQPYTIITLVKVMDNNGDVFTTFTSGKFANVKKDDVITFTGTVYKKDVYNGKESWSLKRCTLK